MELEFEIGFVSVQIPSLSWCPLCFLKTILFLHGPCNYAPHCCPSTGSLRDQSHIPPALLSSILLWPILLFVITPSIGGPISPLGHSTLPSLFLTFTWPQFDLHFWLHSLRIPYTKPLCLKWYRSPSLRMSLARKSHPLGLGWTSS